MASFGDRDVVIVAFERGKKSFATAKKFAEPLFEIFADKTFFVDETKF